MIGRAFIYILIFIGVYACKKENEDYNTYPNNYPLIEIDTNSYTFINKDLNHYYQAYFKSANHVAKFNVKLLKNRQYRFYASQQYSNRQNIALSLVNNSGDTISLSQNIHNEQVLLFNSTADKDLILQAKLMDYNNLSLDCRIFFEERQYPSFSHNNIPWQSYGHYTTLQDTLFFIPTLSQRQRWLMIDKPINQIKTIEYQLEILNADILPSMSIGIADKMITDNYWTEQLLGDGYYYRVAENHCSSTELLDSDTLLLVNESCPFNLTSTTANIKVENISGVISIYVNQNLLSSFNKDIQEKYFYILFDDRLNKTIAIKNTKVIGNAKSAF